MFPDTLAGYSGNVSADVDATTATQQNPANWYTKLLNTSLGLCRDETESQPVDTAFKATLRALPDRAWIFAHDHRHDRHTTVARFAHLSLRVSVLIHRGDRFPVTWTKVNARWTWDDSFRERSFDEHVRSQDKITRGGTQYWEASSSSSSSASHATTLNAHGPAAYTRMRCRSASRREVILRGLFPVRACAPLLLRTRRGRVTRRPLLLHAFKGRLLRCSGAGMHVGAACRRVSCYRALHRDRIFEGIVAGNPVFGKNLENSCFECTGQETFMPVLSGLRIYRAFVNKITSNNTTVQYHVQLRFSLFPVYTFYKLPRFSTFHCRLRKVFFACSELFGVVDKYRQFYPLQWYLSITYNDLK